MPVWSYFARITDFLGSLFSGAKSALILGATGAAGRHLLQELLASSAFNRIGEYGRRITPEESILLGKDKLIQKKIDFENLEDASLKEGNWDVIFITYVPLQAHTYGH